MARGLLARMVIPGRTGVTGFKLGIWKEGYSGSTYVLTPAASPLEIQEDDVEDIFEPVVLSSGYIRIINTSDTPYGSLIPTNATSLYVAIFYGTGAISASETPIWTGYIKPEAFSVIQSGNNEELELPIVSGLSVLESMKPANSNGYDTLAKMILDTVYQSGMRYSELTFDFPKTTRDYTSILGLYLPWQNWWELKSDNSVDDETVTSFKSRFSALEVLKEICKFGNWQLRQDGDQLYFITHDQQQSYWHLEELDMSDITQAQPTTVDAVEWTGSASDIVSTDQFNEEIPGKKSVEVTTDPNKIDSVLLQVDFDKMVYKDTGEIYTSLQDRCRFIHFNENALGSSSDGKRDYNSGTLPACSSYFYVRGQIQYLLVDPDITMYDRWTQSDETTKTHYDWKGSIRMGLSTDTSKEVFHIESKKLYSFQYGQGAFDITGQLLKQTSYWMFDTISGDITLKCRLSIGDLYWNGTTWTTTASTFDIEVEDGQIACTQQLSDDDIENVSGHMVRIPTSRNVAIRGKIVFEIKGCDVANTYMLRSFALSYRAPIENQYSKTEDNYSVKKNIGTFDDDKTINMAVCCKHGLLAGQGVVTDGYGVYQDSVQYAGSVTKSAEDYMVDRMYYHYQYRRVRENREVDIAEEFEQGDAIIYPPTLKWINDDDELSYIIYREWNFGEGTCKIKAISV